MSPDPAKPTLAIYGIPDRNCLPFPEESHDHGLVLMDQGKIIHAMQLERYTGVKHDHRMPEFLFDLLSHLGLLADPPDIVFTNNVLGASLTSANGKIRIEAGWSDEPQTDLVKGRSWWIDQARDAWLVPHELAHVFSAFPFYKDRPEEALMVHFDGGASVSNFSAFHLNGEQVKLIEAHWRLKYLSGFFNANALTFGIIGATKSDQLAVPGKLMGLAGYGQYKEELHSWLKKNNWFSDCWGSKTPFFERAHSDFGWKSNQLSARDPFCQDIVATFHEIFVRETLQELERLRDKTGLSRLIYSGGSALNIVLNGRLSRLGLFDQIWIPPCCNDSGLALGAALFAEWKKGHQIETVSAYLMNNTEPSLTDWESRLPELAFQLAEGRIVAIHQGNGEIGPRALGNRSILCRADRKDLAQKLSMQVKGREWYRPVAPIMTKERVRYFTGQEAPSDLGRFMLDEFHILPERQSDMAGAVHADGTARIQFLQGEKDNPVMWKLLRILEEEYELFCLVNTSFNQRGKPIVQTRDQARQQANAMGISVFFA